MKNVSLSTKRACIALAVALLPGAGGALYAAAATDAPGAVQTARAAADAIAKAELVNSTSVKITYADGHTLLVDFYGDNIFRLFRDDAGGAVRNPQAQPPAEILVKLPRHDLGAALSLDQKATTVTIGTPKVLLSFDKRTGLMSVRKAGQDTPVVEELAPADITETKTELTFGARADEYFYGGGVQNGRFSHKGQKIAIENTNNWVDGGVASPTPFYWSTAGYGLMWHTFKPGTYDFGQTEPGKVKLQHAEGYLDVFLMVNDGPVELLNDFYQLTGHPVLLPKFGFYEGHLNAYNRDYWTPAENGFMLYEDGKRYNESQKDNGGIKESLNGEKNNYQFSARAAIDRYFANDMPLGWFLPNDGYGAGYGQTATLDGNIQNLKEFGEYARSKGVEIGLWTQSDLHPKEGIEALLQRDIVKEVRDAGVRVLKTDVAWVGAGYSFGLNGVADVGEIMPKYGSNARPFIISLDGWAGTQRYAGIWSGDQTGGDWEYIRFHIPTFIGSGLSGQPNITSDVDGIFGGKNVPVNVREFQWKTFTPMELNMDGWGSNPKYPEVLGEPATSINRWYLKMKSELMPYTYSIAREAVNGKPMIRAMFLDYPNSYTLGTQTRYQFLYGPSFLVAPIYKETRADKEGNDVRHGIYLPEGKWVDYYNGDVYEGGCILNDYAAPLWKLPVFVKSGSIIPMTKPNNNPTQIPADFRAYEIYADGETAFTDYDDDGTTQEYLQEKCSRTLVQAKTEGDLLTVDIAPAIGEFAGMVKHKTTELRINVTAQPKSVKVKVGKKKVKIAVAKTREAYEQGENVCYYDPAPELNRFATPGSEFAKVSIKKNPQLLVKIAPCDVTAAQISATVKGFVFAPADPLRTKTGTLAAPKVQFADDDVKTYEVAPSWQNDGKADFYEIEFNGMRYTGIRAGKLVFEDLRPETTYGFKVRAVNKEGASDWTAASVTTKSDPYEFAVKKISAQVSTPDQGGSEVEKLFDFDPRSSWHTAWDKPNATPFDLTLDLRTVNTLERLDYTPREDTGNGTLLKGSYAVSTDRLTWSEPTDFAWTRDNTIKTIDFGGKTQARYIRFHITEAVGGFGSGQEMYVFKVPGTESVLQGDINRDKRIDDNDLTSFMNYTGLRTVDSDFEYVSAGDVNKNGLIDAYDISIVATQLDGGAHASATDKAEGTIAVTPSKTSYKAGDELRLTVSGKNLKCVNALSFALPYNTAELEFLGVELLNMKEMVNLTNDRLHSNGQKELFPTFVNRGNNAPLEDGDLFVIKFKAKKAGKYNLKAIDGMLVDRSLGVKQF